MATFGSKKAIFSFKKLIYTMIRDHSNMVHLMEKALVSSSSIWWPYHWACLLLKLNQCPWKFVQEWEFRLDYYNQQIAEEHFHIHLKDIPYPRHCSPGVLFFNMGFWVGVNSKNPPKSGLFKQKVGVYSRKTPKTRLFTLPGAQFKSGAAMTRIPYLKMPH